MPAALAVVDFLAACGLHIKRAKHKSKVDLTRSGRPKVEAVLFLLNPVRSCSALSISKSE